MRKFLTEKSKWILLFNVDITFSCVSSYIVIAEEYKTLKLLYKYFVIFSWIIIILSLLLLLGQYLMYRKKIDKYKKIFYVFLVLVIIGSLLNLLFFRYILWIKAPLPTFPHINQGPYPGSVIGSMVKR